MSRAAPSASRSARSLEPVLEAQSRKALEIGDAAREEDGIARDAEGGDFQVYGAGARAKALEVVELGGGLGIEGDESEFLQVYERSVKTRVRGELSVPGALAVDGGEPALHHLLSGDDGGEQVGISLGGALIDAPGERTAGDECGEVVRVQDHKHRLSALRVRLRPPLRAEANCVPEEFIVICEPMTSHHAPFGFRSKVFASTASMRRSSSFSFCSIVSMLMAGRCQRMAAPATARAAAGRERST